MVDAAAYRVLVVDDDPDVALYTKTVLERRGGFAVRAVGTAQAALELADEFEPDVVVTDIEMPGMTGLELMSRLRASRPALPVVVITAHVSVDYAVKALRAQANEFLTKPVASADLVSIITRLAEEGRRARSEAAPAEIVLAVGAHPYDVEIGVGGILASHRTQGHQVAILTLAHAADPRTREASQREALVAAELLGARLFVEDLVESEIPSSGSSVERIERVVREVAPTIVYVHSIHDRNQDHRATHEATVLATRAVPTVACYQSTSSTVDFRPTRFVSIEEFIDKKLELLKCLTSRADISAYIDPDYVVSTARYWSRYGATRLVEPLEILREASDLSTPVRRREVSRTLAGGGR